MFVPGGVERGDVTVIGEGQNPFANLPAGGIAASVRYIDGVTGANVFLMTATCARGLATAMGAGGGDEDGPLTELEMSAIGEASNQMLASAAAAISVVIGQEIDISPPDVRSSIGPDTDAADESGAPPHTPAPRRSRSPASPAAWCSWCQTRSSCAWRARSTRSACSRRRPTTTARAATTDGDANVSVPITEKLGDINLRVWAELGRTQLPIGTGPRASGRSSVVDLDRTADAPVDLFVNGLCFGHGNLLVTEDGEWAIEVQTAQQACGPQARAGRRRRDRRRTKLTADSTKGSI